MANFTTYDDYSDCNENKDGLLATCYECGKTVRVPKDALKLQGKKPHPCECGADDWQVETFDTD